VNKRAKTAKGLNVTCTKEVQNFASTKFPVMHKLQRLRLENPKCRVHKGTREFW